jgi:hypothetical protein
MDKDFPRVLLLVQVGSARNQRRGSGLEVMTASRTMVFSVVY